MGVYKVKLPIRGSVVKRLLIIVPVVVLGLTLVSLFMPARRVSIEGVGKVSFETTVTLSVGSEVAYASPDTATNPPTANAGSAWTNPANAYADGTSAATIISGAPSGNNVWGTYGFSIAGAVVSQVRVRYVRYPTGWPVFLQQVVGSVMYERGNGEPLDWKDTAKRVVSSKEVGAAMEPQWLKNIIKGASEAQGESRLNRMLPLLSLVAVLLVLVFVFVLMTKIGGLETAIEGLKLTK